MARRKIILRGDPIISEDKNALAVIQPGLLLMRVPTGLQANTAVANVAFCLAIERDELGKGIDDTYVGSAGASAYAIGDKVKTATFKPGEHAYPFLASGQNVAEGDYLAPTAVGTLTATGVTTTLRVARALESVNASVGLVSAPGARIRVEVV